MDVLDRLAHAVARAPARVVFPEGRSPVTRAAAQALAERGLARPVLLDCDEAPPGCTLGEVRPEWTKVLQAARPSLKEAVALKMLGRPMFAAAAMVAAGEAEALVAGVETPTKRVIEAALMAIGLAPDVTVPSSFFLMHKDGAAPLILADCALSVAPDAGELAAIARASAASAQALLGEARVAMLSYSTGTSGAGESVDRVRAATTLLDGMQVVGPVQADAALNQAIAAKKGLEGWDGANVLVFPALDAGNIAYKLLQELGGYAAIGPCLQGFARPVCDLSRGAKAEDIVNATVVTLALGAVGRA
ncbi:MAG: phosphate acyltransferase [Pseudomonadota bacterium]